jgi:hypothetical protein
MNARKATRGIECPIFEQSLGKNRPCMLMRISLMLLKSFAILQYSNNPQKFLKNFLIKI